MHGFSRFPVSRKDALRKLLAFACTVGGTGLVGFGAFAIGRAIGESTAVGIAFASLASMSLFSPMLSMLSMPGEETRVMGEKPSSLRKVFSGLL